VRKSSRSWTQDGTRIMPCLAPQPTRLSSPCFPRNSPLRWIVVLYYILQ